MYEHHEQPLASPKVFANRLMRNGLIGLALLAFSLFIGTLGYHFIEHLSWLDALLNASMILSGMGPVNPVQTNAGKIFASFYALYSGVIPTRRGWRVSRADPASLPASLPSCG
jgi:hypothetical protein